VVTKKSSRTTSHTFTPNLCKKLLLELHFSRVGLLFLACLYLTMLLLAGEGTMLLVPMLRTGVSKANKFPQVETLGASLVNLAII
jgi:hypothetical protein